MPLLLFLPTSGNTFLPDEKEHDSIHPRILIFTEGTVLGPRYPWEFFRVEHYVPIGRCVEKTCRWVSQGARLVYLTSRRGEKDAAVIRDLLLSAGFPGEGLFYRGEGEEYHHLAEKIIPDVLIEDDCRSIGGRPHWTITNVNQVIKLRIHSIVVREFGGIDHLPDDLLELMKYRK